MLTTARDYADDRSLIFYCMCGSTETVPFLFVGLQADLERAVQKIKVGRRHCVAERRDGCCISKDVERRTPVQWRAPGKSALQ